MLVKRLCEKIPLDEMSQNYICRMTDGCTPAQLQEIVFSLAIENPEKLSQNNLPCTQEIMDHVITTVNNSHKERIGFSLLDGHNNGNGHCPSRGSKI